MRLRLANWIATTVRRRRAVAVATPGTPPPIGPPLDHERVTRVGDVLQACYPEKEEALDDGLTALMLRLTVEPAPQPVPRKR